MGSDARGQLYLQTARDRSARNGTRRMWVLPLVAVTDQQVLPPGTIDVLSIEGQLCAVVLDPQLLQSAPLNPDRILQSDDIG